MQEFHAFQVAPGSEHVLEVPEGQGYHLSIVSLPHNQNSGRSTLYVSVDGKSYAVATVDAQRGIMQVTTDLIFNFEQKAVFQVKGTASVHCVGYRQELDTEDEDMPFGFDDEEDDEGPLKLPVEQATGGAKVEQLDSSDEEDDLDDEEMSDEDEEMADAPADPTQAGPSSEDEDGEEVDMSEDDEEDSDEELDDEEGSDDEEADDEEDSDDEEADDEEDSDDEEAEAMMPPTKSTRGESRGSQGTPSPAKAQGTPSPRKSQGSPQAPRGSQGSPQAARGSKGSPNRSSQGRRSH